MRPRTHTSTGGSRIDSASIHVVTTEIPAPLPRHTKETLQTLDASHERREWRREMVLSILLSGLVALFVGRARARRAGSRDCRRIDVRREMRALRNEFLSSVALRLRVITSGLHLNRREQSVPAIPTCFPDNSTRMCGGYGGRSGNDLSQAAPAARELRYRSLRSFPAGCRHWEHPALSRRRILAPRNTAHKAFR